VLFSSGRKLQKIVEYVCGFSCETPIGSAFLLAGSHSDNTFLIPTIGMIHLQTIIQLT
jgi:hypothetical protein